MDKITNYIILNHLYWAENNITKEEIYEIGNKTKNDVFCNPSMFQIQEYLNYKLDNKKIISASDFEKISFLWTHLSHTEIDLSILKHCINLEEINISCKNLINLEALRHNTKLKKIIAHSNKITSLEALQNHIDLEDLNLDYNPCVSVKPIAHLQKLTNLQFGLIDNETDVLHILRNNPVCTVNYLLKGDDLDFENFTFPYYNMLIIKNESKIKFTLLAIEDAHPESSMIEIPKPLTDNEKYVEKKNKKLFQEMSSRLEKITQKKTIIDQEKTHFYWDYYQFNYVLNFD